MDSLLKRQRTPPTLWRILHLERQNTSVRNLVMSDDGPFHLVAVYAQ